LSSSLSSSQHASPVRGGYFSGGTRRRVTVALKNVSRRPEDRFDSRPLACSAPLLGDGGSSSPSSSSSPYSPTYAGLPSGADVELGVFVGSPHEAVSMGFGPGAATAPHAPLNYQLYALNYQHYTLNGEALHTLHLAPHAKVVLPSSIIITVPLNAPFFFRMCALSLVGVPRGIRRDRRRARGGAWLGAGALLGRALLRRPPHGPLPRAAPAAGRWKGGAVRPCGTPRRAALCGAGSVCVSSGH